MATTVSNSEIGTLVYRHGSPQLAGKVLGSRNVPESKTGERLAHVLWLNGEESWISERLLRDFRALIAGHEKTLANHKKRLAALEKL